MLMFYTSFVCDICIVEKNKVNTVDLKQKTFNRILINVLNII